jgi:hypothetical protein
VATIRREGDELVVLLNDIEKMGALRANVRVPWSAVRSVRVAEQPFREVRGLRFPGTGFPRVIALGTWRYSGGKDFVAVYRGEPAVVVELDGAGFRRLVVSSHDAARLRDELEPIV